MGYIVDGILPAGLTVFTAPPKSGKSWLCLQLAHCVSEGIPFLGRDTVPGKVLYFDLRGNPKRTQKRMEKLGIAGSDTLFFAYKCDSLVDFIYYLRQWKQDNPETKLIIVDEFDCLLNEIGPTQESLVNMIKQWGVEEGVSVVFVTNLCGKSRRARVRALDAVWKAESYGKHRLLLIRGEHVNSSEIAIHFDKERCTWFL